MISFFFFFTIGVSELCRRSEKKRKKKKKTPNTGIRQAVTVPVSDTGPCNLACISHNFLSPREIILVGPGRKHLDPTIYFPSSLPNQTHFKKKFLLIFFPKFSIHPILPSNKHTLKVRLLKVQVFGVWHTWVPAHT